MLLTTLHSFPCPAFALHPLVLVACVLVSLLSVGSIAHPGIDAEPKADENHLPAGFAQES